MRTAVMFDGTTLKLEESIYEMVMPIAKRIDQILSLPIEIKLPLAGLLSTPSYQVNYDGVTISVSLLALAMWAASEVISVGKIMYRSATGYMRTVGQASATSD